VIDIDGSSSPSASRHFTPYKVSTCILSPISTITTVCSLTSCYRVPPSTCFLPPPPIRTCDPRAALRGDCGGLEDRSPGDSDTVPGPWARTLTGSVSAALMPPINATGAVTHDLGNKEPPVSTLGLAISAVTGFVVLT
jgi:hypothetical protein